PDRRLPHRDERAHGGAGPRDPGQNPGVRRAPHGAAGGTGVRRPRRAPALVCARLRPPGRGLVTASLHVSVLGAFLAATFAVPMAALLLWMLRLPRPVAQEVARAVPSGGGAE